MTWELHPRPITAKGLALLEALAHPAGRPIDAKYWADEIVELLKLGYVELTGTLQHAILRITDKGRVRLQQEEGR